MKKHLYVLSVFILLVARFAANTPSQFGNYKKNPPDVLKKKHTIF